LKLFSSFSIISQVLKDISKEIIYFSIDGFFLTNNLILELWAIHSREGRKFLGIDSSGKIPAIKFN
jgi:hypothetical protein